MNKQLEIFDAVANTVKQVFNNLLSAQQGLSVQWIDGINKTHAAVISIPGLPESMQTKEALNHINTWFNTVATSSQNASSEALKTQESWISAYEKQLTVSREILKNFIALSSSALPQATQAKAALPKAALPKALSKADLAVAA